MVSSARAYLHPGPSLGGRGWRGCSWNRRKRQTHPQIQPGTNATLVRTHGCTPLGPPGSSLASGHSLARIRPTLERGAPSRAVGLQPGIRPPSNPAGRPRWSVAVPAGSVRHQNAETMTELTPPGSALAARSTNARHQATPQSACAAPCPAAPLAQYAIPPQDGQEHWQSGSYACSADAAFTLCRDPPQTARKSARSLSDLVEPVMIWEQLRQLDCFVTIQDDFCFHIVLVYLTYELPASPAR
jgi:hypothetical protein